MRRSYHDTETEFLDAYPELNGEWEAETRRRRTAARSGYSGRTAPFRPSPRKRYPRPPFRRPPTFANVGHPQPRPEPVDREPPDVPPSQALPEPFAEGSEYVRWVQDSLNRILQLRIPVDGIMGLETRSAIRSFQTKKGLQQSGIIGPDTKQALISALKSENAELTDLEWETEVSQSSPEYVRWVQRSLNAILGLRLAEDGSSGVRTRSAIRSFQKQYGLAADGIVGPMTEAALKKASGLSLPDAGASAPLSVPGPGPVDTVTVRGITVARPIAQNVNDLLTAAEEDGIRLSGWGYRSTAKQIDLRKKHCGTSDYAIYKMPSSQCTPPTAPPGKSMHEKGLAIDFTYNGQTIKNRTSPAFLWLQQNAGGYGLKNFPKEPWHWSTTGT